MFVIYTFFLLFRYNLTTVGKFFSFHDLRVDHAATVPEYCVVDAILCLY